MSDETTPLLEPARIRSTADALARFPYSFWNWGDSTGIEGLIRASELLGDSHHRGIAYGMVKAWARITGPLVEKDNTAPGRAMCLLYEESQDPDVLLVALRLAEFLQRRRRLSEGPWVVTERALLVQPYDRGPLSAHEAVLLHDPGAAAYVDELHMTPPFLAHLGRITKREDLVNVAATESLLLLRLLQDESSSLMWHFYLERTASRYIHAWGRGQGWALLGILDVIDALPMEHEARGELEQRFTALCSAVTGWQRPDGGWDAIIDDPASGPESSTSAFYLTAVLRAVNIGLSVPEEQRLAAAHAWTQLANNITDQGLLRGVSSEVYASTQLRHYSSVPKGLVVPWGLGTLLMGMAEASRSGWTLPTDDAP